VVVIAIGIGVAIMATGFWIVHLLATPPPPEPNPEDLSVVDQTFVCTVCGMQLTVTYAQSGDLTAPRHCREEMVPA